MSASDVIQWSAFVVGTVGSILWAHNGAWAKYAGAFWLVASLLWVWFARLSGVPGLAARDLVSILTALWGAWRWLGADKKSKRDRAPLPPARFRAGRSSGAGRAGG